MAQRRDKVLGNGMPHQQLDSVLAEFREQQIKAAKDTKVAHAMAKKQGSVEEDEAAVSIAVAGEAGEVVAGSAVAGEAGDVVAGYAVAGEAEHYVCLVRKSRCKRVRRLWSTLSGAQMLGRASWAPT